MPVTVYIPTAFRKVTQNRARIDVAAGSVAGALEELERTYGGLTSLVRDDGGAVHDHVNIYVNNEAIEALEGLATGLKDGDEVAIIPALAGGAGSCAPRACLPPPPRAVAAASAVRRAW